MKSRTKRIIVVVSMVTAFFGTMAAWAAFRVVAWARDLPDRIVIDTEGMGDAFGVAVMSAYRQGLVDGTPETQKQILTDLNALATQDQMAGKSIAEEFSVEISELTESDDAEVATEARHLMELLGEECQASDVDSTRQLSIENMDSRCRSIT